MRLLKIATVVSGFLFLPRLLFADANYDSQLDQLKQKTEDQETLIQQQQKTIEYLMNRMTDIEQKLDQQVPSPLPAAQTAQPNQRLNLTTGEYSSLPGNESPKSVLENPWWKNIVLSGYGAAGFLWTGGRSVRQHGGFLNYEASINVDAKVWEDVHYFHEISTVPIGDMGTRSVGTNQVYVQFQDVMKTLFNEEGTGIGAKIGRMDIPFGEEYLTQHVIDNPLISFSAAWPWFWDEGLEIYNSQNKIKWIAAVMDGDTDRSFDSTNDKAVILKLYGNPTEKLYLSGSFMRNGKTSESAMLLGYSYLMPVGSEGFSSLGTSPSSEVSPYLYEADAQYQFGEDRYLKGQIGYVWLNDKNEEFDRDIYYFQLEPKWNLGPRFDNKWAIVGRFSGVGTFNDHKGYLFSGPIDTGGDFGFDTSELYRYALGLNFYPNPHTLIKMEYSVDDFHLIDHSPKGEAGTKGRNLVGIITAVKF